MPNSIRPLLCCVIIIFFVTGCAKAPKYEYDSKKRVVKEFFYDQNGKVSSYKKYDYNDADVQMKETDYEGDVIRHTIENNEKGLKIKESYFDDKGQLLTYSTFEYNDKGWRIKWSIFDKEDKLQEYDILKYDDKGNVTVVYTYNSTNDLKRIIDQSTTKF